MEAIRTCISFADQGSEALHRLKRGYWPNYWLLAPEPVNVGTFRADKTGGLLIGKIHIEKGSHGCVQLSLCLNEPVVLTNGTKELPVPDHNRIRFSFAKAWH